MEGQHQEMDGRVFVVVAAHRGQQKAIGQPLQRMRLSEYTNDAWASSELLSLVSTSTHNQSIKTRDAQASLGTPKNVSAVTPSTPVSVLCDAEQ